MLRIVTHIERLLFDHDCVIVPKFGGFVLQTVHSVYNATEHTFRPLAKEIVFNTTLQHNDGLLSESYMQMYGVNYRKAQLMVEEDIEELKYSLMQYKQLSLDELGVLTVGSEGQIVFHPGKADVFGTHSYGLPVFQFPVLPPLQSVREEVTLLTREQQKRDTLYIPVSRRLVRTFVASAAAIAFFLLVSTPVKEVNQAAYTASFIPTEIVSRNITTEVFEQESSDVITSDIEEVPVIVTPAVEVKANIASPAVSASIENKSRKMYHIVIASFPTESQADEYISKVDTKACKHVSKVVRDGKYRIYADRFDNRQEAESYMATLRQNEKYKDAWLFISR